MSKKTIRKKNNQIQIQIQILGSGMSKYVLQMNLWVLIHGKRNLWTIDKRNEEKIYDNYLLYDKLCSGPKRFLLKCLPCQWTNTKRTMLHLTVSFPIMNPKRWTKRKKRKINAQRRNAFGYFNIVLLSAIFFFFSSKNEECLTFFSIVVVVDRNPT